MEHFSFPLSEQLRARALALPETGESTSCVNRAFRVRKKNFLFLGEPDGRIRVMVKLVDSLEAARAMQDPRVDVGKTGWVTLRFDPDDALDEELLSAWIHESFRAMAPTTVLKQLEP
jgi:predicted DNA-binding protein (MmcQ/YjbR family)